MKNIIILGSTGSVGKQSLEVIRQYPNQFKVVGIAALGEIEEIKSQLEEFKPEIIYIDKNDTNKMCEIEFVELTMGIEDYYSFYKDLCNDEFRDCNSFENVNIRDSAHDLLDVSAYEISWFFEDNKFIVIHLHGSDIEGSLVSYFLDKYPPCYINNIENEIASKDKFADWNTYRSEEFGIEFKYPKDWVLSASREKESFIILENQNNVSQKIEFLKSSGPPPEIMDMEIVGTEDIMVDDLYAKREFFRHKIEYKYHLRVFIVEENLFYYTDFDEDNLDELPLIYDKILSTIKFID